MGDGDPFSSTVNKGISWMEMELLQTAKDLMCGTVEISVDLILILAAVKTEKFSMFLSTSINPPKSWAIDSNI